MIDRNYPGLSSALVTSVVWRATAAIVDAFAIAWKTSIAARLATAATFLANTASISAIGAIALGVTMLARPVLPEYVRPALPAMWGVAATLAVGLIAVFPASFVRAWPHSGVRRVLTLRPRE